MSEARATKGVRELLAFLTRERKDLRDLVPLDLKRFREDLLAREEAGEISPYQLQSFLTQARKWLKGRMGAGLLDRERFFLVLHPMGLTCDYDPLVTRSRAFSRLSPSMAASYRRGAQALLLHLASLGKGLSDVTRGDWRGFQEKVRAQVSSREVKRPVARMRLCGARRFLEEKVRCGLVAPDVLLPPRAPEPPLSVWVARLQDAMAVEGLGQSTRINYTRAVRDLLAYLDSEGIRAMSEVTREVVTAYELDLQRRSSKKGVPYAASTQTGMIAGLRFFFSHLVKGGLLLTDPSVHLTYPRQVKRLPRPLGIEAMRRLLTRRPTSILEMRDRAILETLYETGMRGGEVARLRLEDVDFEAGTILVREGKGRKDRMVPLGKKAREALLNYLEARGQSGRAVFLGRHGTALTARQMRRRLKELGARFGFSLHPHLLRHTCATHLLKGRADIRHIQRLLGHKNLQTTERYTRVEVGDLREVIKRCHPREKGRSGAS